MKFLRLIIAVFFLLLTTMAAGQSDNIIAKAYFDEGLTQYHSGKSALADSLFNLSLTIEPSIEAVYYRTISKINLSKTCKKCNKYRINYLCGDEESGGKFSNECIMEDSVIYNNLSTPDTIYYCKQIIPLCSGIKEVTYKFCKMIRNSLVSSFTIENDTTFTTNPISTYPDPVKLPFEKIFYYLAPEMPVFPGGKEAMDHYIQKNLRPPDEDDDVGYTVFGSVVVTFTVDENGKISNPRIEKGMNKYCNEESIRLISSMPAWKPGKINGKPAKYRLIYPVAFALHFVSMN